VLGGRWWEGRRLRRIGPVRQSGVSSLLANHKNRPLPEHPLPEGRKNYTKTAPIQFEEFAPVIQWWDQPGPGTKREENERAWRVPAAELLANGCNLDRKNPRAKEDITHLPPTQLAADILKKEQRIAEIMGNIQKLLVKHGT